MFCAKKNNKKKPEGSGVVVNCLLVPTGVFQEVGIVVVDFGIVRQRLDTRTTIRKKSMWEKNTF